MKNERQSRLEILAYKIWEERGRPEGRDEENWAEAERRLRFESDGRSTSQGSDGLSPEGKNQDTPGRSNPASSRQQTHPYQSTQTGSPDLDGKSAASKRNRPARSGAAGGDSQSSDSKSDR